jgi:4-hydroxybenzoate polyprenyltransferase
VSLVAINDWFLGLGAQYGVNPYIFGAIYVGAIPFFLASVAWMVRRKRAGRSITVPVLCAGFCFVSAYLYLAIAGRNIPAWVWAFLAVLIAFAAYSTIRDTKRKLREAAVDKSA